MFPNNTVHPDYTDQHQENALSAELAALSSQTEHFLQQMTEK